MIARWWARANVAQRLIVVPFLIADAGVALLLLAAYAGRGPDANAVQYAAGWFGLWFVVTSVLFGICAACLAAAR